MTIPNIATFDNGTCLFLSHDQCYHHPCVISVSTYVVSLSLVLLSPSFEGRNNSKRVNAMCSDFLAPSFLFLDASNIFELLSNMFNGRFCGSIIIPISASLARSLSVA